MVLGEECRVILDLSKRGCVCGGWCRRGLGVGMPPPGASNAPRVRTECFTAILPLTLVPHYILDLSSQEFENEGQK